MIIFESQLYRFFVGRHSSKIKLETSQNLLHTNNDRSNSLRNFNV